MVSVTLSYNGALADNNVIDMYDAARGLAGFHRSLALTTHLLLNGEIITQAPSLKGAEILSTTPEEGSWKVTALVLAGIWGVATAPKDSVPGHLLFSAYDYVVQSTLGFHVDFDKSLGQSYEDKLKSKKITVEKFDSLIEKTESSIADMHRPIVASRSATGAKISGHTEYYPSVPIGPELSTLTYEYISRSVLEPEEQGITGIVSSFNVNTFKGRIFVIDEMRPIPFELGVELRNRRAMSVITSSLHQNSRDAELQAGLITIRGRRLITSTGRLKAIVVTAIG